MPLRWDGTQKAPGVLQIINKCNLISAQESTGSHLLYIKREIYESIVSDHMARKIGNQDRSNLMRKYGIQIYKPHEKAKGEYSKETAKKTLEKIASYVNATLTYKELLFQLFGHYNMKI